MDHSKLKEALEIWRKAFGIFHDCHFPTFSFGKNPAFEMARGWLRQNKGQIPEALTPTEDEIDGVARMICSFPSTSVNKDAFTLRRSPGRGSRKLKGKANSKAEVLKRFTLERIASESGLELSFDCVERLAADFDRHLDLILVTYAGELIRRTEFASQGLPVYWLWLQLDPEQRKNITCDSITEAERRVADWLRSESVATKPI